MAIRTEVMQRSDQFQYDPSSYGSKYRDMLSTRTSANLLATVPGTFAELLKHILLEGAKTPISS